MAVDNDFYNEDAVLRYKYLDEIVSYTKDMTAEETVRFLKNQRYVSARQAEAARDGHARIKLTAELIAEVNKLLKALYNGERPYQKLESPSDFDTLPDK